MNIVVSARAFTVALLLAWALVAGCSSVSVDEPVFDTPQAAIEDAIAGELGMPVSLEVETFRQDGDWAFVAGRPLSADRTPIDYSATPYAQDLAEGYFDDNFVALVRRAANADTGWSLIELSVGATDAPFVDWPERHGLPRALVMPGSGGD